MTVQDIEWEDDSAIVCCACDHSGTVREFTAHESEEVCDGTLLDGYHLNYLVNGIATPKCWSVTDSIVRATEDMGDVFNQVPDAIFSVFVEEWRNGKLIGTTHLYPDTHGEGMDE